MPENTISNGASARRNLYPPIAPYDMQRLKVGGGHSLYYEQCGNPTGQPVVVLHGGPGGGCNPMMRRYFDPKAYRIILFDQRGCGRSTPFACVENNTTHDLIADIELIRHELRIDRWIVFGGSWGATLSLLYAQAHPERVKALVLRGVFLLMQRELDWFYQGGAGNFFPEEWQRFIGLVPEEERGDFIAAYNKRLFGPDLMEQSRFARAWTAWESNLALLQPPHRFDGGVGDFARAFARIENHYFTHKGWVDEGQILAKADRLSGIPGHIVQGRYDMICPPRSAYDLHKSWQGSHLHMVPSAGHAMTEPGIMSALISIMDDLHRH